MDNFYNESIDTMQKAGVNTDYITGWASGYLGNPSREEQRVNDAYQSGYEDGQAKNAGNYSIWSQ